MSGLDSRLRDVHSISLTPRSPLFFGHPGRCLAVVLGKSRNSALPVSIQHISKNLSNQASFRTVTSANFVPMGVLSTQSSNTATRGLGVGAIGRKLTSLIAAKPCPDTSERGRWHGRMLDCTVATILSTQFKGFITSALGRLLFILLAIYRTSTLRVYLSIRFFKALIDMVLTMPGSFRLHARASEKFNLSYQPTTFKPKSTPRDPSNLRFNCNRRYV